MACSDNRLKTSDSEQSSIIFFFSYLTNIKTVMQGKKYNQILKKKILEITEITEIVGLLQK